MSWSQTFLLFLVLTISCSITKGRRVDICQTRECCGTGMHTPDVNGSYDGTTHKYEVYDPRDNTLLSWQQWSLICMGTGGYLVRLGSRREMDCLIQYINDEIDSTRMDKYAIGLHGKADKGVFEWYYVYQTPEDFDAPTPSFSNWKTGVVPSTANAPCVYMEVGQTTVASGLWSVSACNTNTMLGICEYDL